MPRIITYSLRLEHPNSDGYYRSIAAFTDRWTSYAVDAVKEAISGFHTYRQTCGASIRSEAEYALELLALGVLLDQSDNSSSKYPRWTIHFMAFLTESQKRWPKLEPAIKKLRGLLQGIFLRSEKNTEEKQTTQNCDIASLMRWLQAQGENGMLHRLAQWQDYLLTLDTEKRRVILASCLVLVGCFSEESDHALGDFSAGIESFLTKTAPRHRWDYDSAFVSRTRLEYHLGMLATETLNRAYRQRFMETRRKVVIVPPCMREQPDQDCKAVETPLGSRCQACKPTCRVHHVTKLGEKLGFEVFIIPDELRGIGAEAKRGADNIGLVGVSCALTNWSGGWDAEELGIPAQGLLLDYVGCRYHWDEIGISTDTNLAKLREIMGLEENSGHK
jgi:hypothetical protein